MPGVSNGSFSYDKFADILRRVRESVHSVSPTGLLEKLPSATTPENVAAALSPFSAGRGGQLMNAFMNATDMGVQGDILKGYKPPWERSAPVDPASTGLPAPSSMGAPSTPMPPMQGLDLPWMPPMPRARPQEAPGAPSGAPSAVPMPMARPAEAPAPQEDTGFFMRNALMQQDPLGGGFIDPTGAASVSGPDLIQKMMGYLHRKV